MVSFDLQAVFSKKRFHGPLKPFTSGYKLEDYIIGNQIGKGANAVVYKATAQYACPKASDDVGSPVQVKDDEEKIQTVRSPACCSLRNFPLAIKMIWNFGVSDLKRGSRQKTKLSFKVQYNNLVFCNVICLQAGSSNEAIIKSMSEELVPAGPLALKCEKEQIILDG